MEVMHYIEEVEKYIGTLKNQIEDEKKEIADGQKKFSSLLSSFSKKAPSNSVINSLFKDEEPEGFVFSKHEDKRKQLAEQRRAEYNAYLEKKEAERLAKKRGIEEKRSVSPKSILDAVDYERVLAKRKEEEAKFRNMNHADVPNSYKPVLSESFRRTNVLNATNELPDMMRYNNYPPVNLPGAVPSSADVHAQVPVVESKNHLHDILEKENIRLLEEKLLAKHLEEQRRQMFLEFESELKKNNKIKEEILNLKTSIQSSPQRLNSGPPDGFPKMGRTGGGGDPVRDSYGNLMTMRGLRKENSLDSASIMSFPSMNQEQAVKDRTTLYREELQKQIEEKKRLEALEKAKIREEEDRLAQRMEEQRLRMLKEYENEHKKTDKVKEEFLRQQERIRQLEEFQRRDAEERAKRLAAERPPEQLVPTQPVEIVPERSNSPPIPSVRSKALLEKAAPVIPEVKPENVFSSLAEIRRKIKEEQQKQNKEKSYEVINRRTVQELSDDEEDDILKTSYKYAEFE